MYVALTRARRRLYLSFAQSRMLHGQTRYNIPSRFLQEIPDSLLKWLQPCKSTMRNGIRRDHQACNQRRYKLRHIESGFAASAWRIGQNVIHAKFGAGVIVNCEGHGADARVEVRFGRAGTKWLLLEYAKLASTEERERVASTPIQAGHKICPGSSRKSRQTESARVRTIPGRTAWLQ